MSSTRSQYRKINRIFQNNDFETPQNTTLTNPRALKSKSSTITKPSSHQLQRSKSNERSVGDQVSTIQNPSKLNNKDQRDKLRRYYKEDYNRDSANNRLMRNYTSYELNRTHTGDISSSYSRNGRTSSLASSTTSASHYLRNPITGKRIRSRSEDHLLHVSDGDCCDHRGAHCEECGEESPFYLHDPSTVGYNRLCDLFTQTSSDDSGLCLNSSSHSPNPNSVPNPKHTDTNGFVNRNSRFNDTSTNKSKISKPVFDDHKSNQTKNGSRALTRPRRAAPLPPIPNQSNNVRNGHHREVKGRVNYL